MANRYSNEVYRLTTPDPEGIFRELNAMLPRLGDRLDTVQGYRGTSTIQGVLVVTGDLSVGDDLTVPGDLSVGGAATIDGTLSAGATTLVSLTVSGSTALASVTASGTLSVTGALSAGATTLTSLTVSGATALASVTASGTLSVTGASTLGTLTAGATTLASAAVSGTLSVTGAAEILGELTVDDVLAVPTTQALDDTAWLQLGLQVSSDLGVGGMVQAVEVFADTVTARAVEADEFIIWDEGLPIHGFTRRDL